MDSKFFREDLERLCREMDRLALGGSTLFVTGVTGLIGSILARAIQKYNEQYAQKIRLVGLARSKEKVMRTFDRDFLQSPDCRIVYQDICQPLPDIPCDYIVHAANSTNSKTFLTNPVEVIDSICTGSKYVLELARRNAVKGMVYLSSMEVFGSVDRAERIAEKDLGYLDIQNVRSCYSEGKRLAECLCKSYAEEYDVPVKVARLAQTFGAGVLPGENRVFAQFARSARKGENIVLHTQGTSMGNYVYTSDALKAILLLLVRGENGAAYTVVNEKTTMTIRDMAALVAQTVSHGKSKVVFEIPEGNRYGYAPETKMRLSGKKLSDLGWQPEYDLAEMYERMLPSLD